jgi:hypothetical protein
MRSWCLIWYSGEPAHSEVYPEWGDAAFRATSFADAMAFLRRYMRL